MTYEKIHVPAQGQAITVAADVDAVRRHTRPPHRVHRPQRYPRHRSAGGPAGGPWGQRGVVVLVGELLMEELVLERMHVDVLV